ncbi:hypothetical protein [Haloactinomyces albus]|uniref:Uncharacterized protein n=1 Tax=Haloactinomyces albus TaxID=1352928 RepID=A0AAE3ZBW6_9ACTN|nr:hypothetical protein [Haloactinomyces albus]MDR7301050.1 hypothetical protein [Haloactinomyces albus]
MNRHERTAQLMTQAVFMLSHAASDVRLGRYSSDERAHLADGLDRLSAALRDTDQPMVITATTERTDDHA